MRCPVSNLNRNCASPGRWKQIQHQPAHKPWTSGGRSVEQGSFQLLCRLLGACKKKHPPFSHLSIINNEYILNLSASSATSRPGPQRVVHTHTHTHTNELSLISLSSQFGRGENKHGGASGLSRGPSDLTAVAEKTRPQVSSLILPGSNHYAGAEPAAYELYTSRVRSVNKDASCQFSISHILLPT